MDDSPWGVTKPSRYPGSSGGYGFYSTRMDDAKQLDGTASASP